MKKIGFALAVALSVFAGIFLRTASGCCLPELARSVRNWASNSPLTMKLIKRLAARGFHEARRLPRTFALVLVFLSGVCVFPAQSEPHIELNLTVTQTTFRPTAIKDSNKSVHLQRIPVTNTWSSRCVFGQKKWLIESHFSRNAVDYYYCDGTNVYETKEITFIPADFPAMLARMNSPSLMGQTNLPKATDPILLSIIPGIQPLSDTGGNLPWLAYCSGSYVSLPNQLIPLLAADVRHDPMSFAFEHQEEVYSDDLGLPKNLSLLCSGKLRKSSPFDPRLIRGNEVDVTSTGVQVRSARDRAHSDGRYVDGMLAAQYTVTESTNIAGCTIPTVFTYDQFQMQANRSVPFLLATGVATNIHLAQEPQSLILPAKSYQAVDFRFRSPRKTLDCIEYPITNGMVPATSDPGLQLMFKSDEKLEDTDPTSTARQ